MKVSVNHTDGLNGTFLDNLEQCLGDEMRIVEFNSDSEYLRIVIVLMDMSTPVVL